MTSKSSGKCLHIAEVQRPKEGKRLLLLREASPRLFCWHEELPDGKEQQLELSAPSVEEALRLAQKKLRPLSFRTIKCGFRYALPERDEHGMNALFHQMAASQEGFGGIYFDEEVGHNCFVQNASHEALELLKRLRAEDRL